MSDESEALPLAERLAIEEQSNTALRAEIFRLRIQVQLLEEARANA
jgi:hypothetical protein